MTLHKKAESYTMTATGVSAGSAIGSAIGGVRSGSGGSHIVVLSVTPMPDGTWQATVMVVIDPELESILEQRLHKQHEEDEYRRTHLKEEKEKEKESKHAFYIEGPALKNVHAYLSIEDYDELFDQLVPVKKEFDDTYEEDLYFIPLKRDSEAWINVEDMALDYAFHRAALSDKIEPKSVISDGGTAPIELDLEPSKQLGLNEEPTVQYEKKQLDKHLELEGDPAPKSRSI